MFTSYSSNKKANAILKLHAKDDKAKFENEKIQQQFYAFFTENMFNQNYCEKFNASLQRKNVKVSETYKSKFEIGLICNKLQTLLPNLDIMQALTDGPIPLIHVQALKNFIEKNSNPLLLRRLFAFLEASRLNDHPLNKAILEEYRGILLKRAAESSQYLRDARRKTRELQRIQLEAKPDTEETFIHQLRNLLVVNSMVTTLDLRADLTMQQIFTETEVKDIQEKLQMKEIQPAADVFSPEELTRYQVKINNFQMGNSASLQTHGLFKPKTAGDAVNHPVSKLSR